MSDDILARIRQLEQENRELREALSKNEAFIRQVLGSYVTSEVAEEILGRSDALSIEAERRQVAMLFTDLIGSTEIAESMDAGDYVRLYDHYLTDMIAIIDAWQGNVLEFAGDGIVAVFGAPRPNDDAARCALCSAVAMQRHMGALNRWNEAHGYPALSVRMGVHVGEAIVGTIGSEARMKYDMIGRNVNLASRIMSAAAGGQILASTKAIEAAGEDVAECRTNARWIRPKGFNEQVLVHEVLGVGNLRLPAERS